MYFSKLQLAASRCSTASTFPPPRYSYPEKDAGVIVATVQFCKDAEKHLCPATWGLAKTDDATAQGFGGVSACLCFVYHRKVTGESLEVTVVILPRSPCF